ncbi:hypothetical protein WME76_36850 [Sorangium sp. So ce119]|uniref:hypothetical protein n=1 Tax=Sorangium sp. So ce119 TaxID=3133279 RepID=UPI003F5F22CE
MRIVYVLGAAAMVTAGFGLCVAKVRAQQHQIDGLGARVSALAESIEQTDARCAQARVAAVSAARPRDAGRTRGAAPPDGDGAGAQDATAPPTRADAGLVAEHRRPLNLEDAQDRVERVFLGEAPDPGWAREAERALEERLAAALPRSSAIHAVECRASLCRVEAAHRDPTDGGRLFDDAFKNPASKGWNADVFSTPPRVDERGNTVVVMYLAREGEALPSLEQRDDLD